MLVNEKVILITGGSRGIGRAISRLSANTGTKTIIHYHRDENAANETLKMVESNGGSGMIVQADLRNSQQVIEMSKEIHSRFGRLDVLVNNAGIRQDRLMLTMPDSEWQNVINSNLNSVFYCCKAFGKYMVMQKRGAIVNISSLSGVCGRIAQANYAASKAGVIGLTKSLAIELAKWNIRVNAVVPGLIETDMTKDLDPKIIEAMNIPMKRMGTPDEVARCVMFLASDDASYITGATIDVNGGVYT